MSRYLAFSAAFELLAHTRVCPIVRRLSRVKGVIFTLHRVLPQMPLAFAPNAILQVTPDFLEHVILTARQKGFEIVDLDTAVARINDQGPTAPFVVLTFDDAYRDNLEFALPVLRKHGAPFTLYVPTALVEGQGEVWWQALEDIIAASPVVSIPDGAGTVREEAATTFQKLAIYDRLYSLYRAMPEPERVVAIHALAQAHGFDLRAHCRNLIMDWESLRTFAEEPLCTIGAHTIHHYELAKLAHDDAVREMAASADVLENAFGARPRHFSYPIGGPASAGPREYAMASELGFETAVTTRPGGLYHEHASHLTALPRVSLNGAFQKKRYLDVFLTGSVFSMLNGNRKVNVR